MRQVGVRGAPARQTHRAAASAASEELRAEAEYAAQRLALYRRRVRLGQGDARRLAELERIATGGAARLERARTGAHGEETS